MEEGGDLWGFTAVDQPETSHRGHTLEEARVSYRLRWQVALRTGPGGRKMKQAIILISASHLAKGR